MACRTMVVWYNSFMRAQKIEGIKRRYHREWLLIAVDEMDEATTIPLKGRLLTHSPHRDEVYRKLRSLQPRRDILVEYSEDSLPKGYAAAF